MNAETPLVIIATFAAMRPFFEVPEARTKGRILKAAGYQSNIKAGCFYLLMLPVIMGLWWWYAVATDAILLGIIPTIGLVATLLATFAEGLAVKAGQR